MENCQINLSRRPASWHLVPGVRPGAGATTDASLDTSWEEANKQQQKKGAVCLKVSGTGGNQVCVKMEKHKASRETGFIFNLLEDSHEQWGGRFFYPTQKWSPGRSVARRHGGTGLLGSPGRALSLWDPGGLQDAAPLAVQSRTPGRQARDACRLPPKLLRTKSSTLAMVKSCTAPTVHASSLGAPTGGQVWG